MRRKFLLPVLAIVCAAAAAVAPAEKFNVPGQHRTRTPGEMKGEKIPLRFADGTPTGFFAHADDPSKYGDHRRPAKRGFLELDAQEILTTAEGMKLLFHPGGGPDHYEDYVEKGQYGHVAVEDLKSPVKLTPVGLNGKPAPWKNGASYLVTPTRIPRDMWYKPNVEDGRSGSTYFTYGNPGYDKTRGRGDWTYINWSWVQNGGEKYPENVCRGGGMVRAIGKRGMTFTAADVEPVIGYSYGADNQINGRVTAFYGRTTTGGGGGDSDGGSEIFGWLPHSYQKAGDIIVPCVRRSWAASEPVTPPASDDRMERMAWNLMSEAPPDDARRAEILKRFGEEADPQAQMELLTELARLDDVWTVRAMLNVLGAKTDTRIREQAIVLIGYLRASPDEMQRVCDVLAMMLHHSENPRERLRTIEILGNFATAESRRRLQTLRAAVSGDEAKAVDEALARTKAAAPQR